MLNFPVNYRQVGLKLMNLLDYRLAMGFKHLPPLLNAIGMAAYQQRVLLHLPNWHPRQPQLGQKLNPANVGY